LGIFRIKRISAAAARLAQSAKKMLTSALHPVQMTPAIVSIDERLETAEMMETGD